MELIGLTVEEARKTTQIAVVKVDGKQQCVTADYRPTRARVVVTNGVISEIVGFG